MTQAPPTSPRTFTRDDILRLGQVSRPWDFLPIAAKAIDQSPADLALRFLASANCARLGLRTLAQEQLATFPAEALTDPDVQALATAISSLPDDRLSPRQRLETATANAAALQARDLTLSLDQWALTLDRTDCFRTLDHNIVRRPAGSKALSACSGLFNQHAAAQHFISTTKAHRPADLSRVILEGIDPPALLQALYAAVPPTILGHHPRLYIVQADPLEFLDALSFTDLRPILQDPRAECFVGPDASQRLLTTLRSRIDFSLPTLAVPASTCRTRCTPPVDQIFDQAINEQQNELDRLSVRIAAAYEPRTPDFWRRRYQEALSGGPPLRILIPTSRYTTYVQHAARDLAQTLTSQGHTAELLIEPDDHTHFSSVAYQRVIDRLNPDLIILINYPRRSLGNVFPANVPYICWLQDAMPHLFNRDLGASQTSLDFLVGHTFPDLFEKYAYPIDRVLPISLVADERKFHPAPVPAALRDKHACDIAFVSHHSESPPDMFSRLIKEVHAAPAVQQALTSLWPDIQRIASEASTQVHHRRLKDLALSRLTDILGREPDQKTLTLLMNTAIIPLADRILRHESLSWAADLAEERGYRLHIYGRGWENHPRFSAYAKGELFHGEDLRASYQSARVHLHISGTALVHQRVVECYISGGLCLCRLHRDAIAGPKTTAQLALSLLEPDTRNHATGLVGYTIANHPETMSLAAQLARVGHPLQDPVFWIAEQRRLNQRRLAPAMATDHDAAWLLRDLAETTFSSKDQLATLVQRAIERPAWREAVNTMVCKNARATLTHAALARRMINIVQTSLGVHALREAV